MSETPVTPRTARFRRSAAAAALDATTPLSSSPQQPPTTPRPNDSNPSSQLGDKRVHSDDEADNRRAVRQRPADSRDLSYLVGPTIKDLKLPTAAIGRIQRYAKAPTDERAFMAFVNTEVLLTKFKDAADDWEIPAPLKTHCKTALVACFLSPHIPEYKGNLVKHVAALIPPSSRHLLPDDANPVHKALLKSFVLDSATAVRNAIKTVIARSMSRFDTDAKSDVVDVTQGWCIGRLCDEIVAKLGTEADIQVTTEVQGRIALLRFVYASHPAQAATSEFWGMVDKTLKQQRDLDPVAMARDIADGLTDDIKQYVGDCFETYTLVDAKSISPDSLQSAADKTMREYYRTVKPRRAAADK